MSITDKTPEAARDFAHALIDASAGLGTGTVQGLAQHLHATIAHIDAEPGLRVDLRMVRRQPDAGSHDSVLAARESTAP